MPDPLRVLFLGGQDTEPIVSELRRGGYEPSVQCVDAPPNLPGALAAGWEIAICESVDGDCGALAALRAIQERALDLPVIVVSGKIRDSEVLVALAAGAADHMTRGNLMRLNAAVARELRAVRLRRERLRLEEQIAQAQKMEAVGRLAAGVAHDFNNLLTIITGYSDLLLSQPVADDAQRTGLEEIRRAAERGGALTYQLLAFSRRRALEVRTVSLNEKLLQMERMFRRLIGEDINLVTLPAASPDTVECDPGRLDQVILNLVVNARDAMPKGGRLTIETGNVQVGKRPSAGQLDVPPGRYVTLTVTDTGIGMDAETRSHLFEPFFTTKVPGRGTGLGLATAYGFVHQAGGAIGVSSEPGRGAQAQIYLPLVADKGARTERRAAAVTASAGAETILVVEDDARVRKLIVGVLRGRGYMVIEATRGDEAVRRAKAHRGTIDLAVVDVVMPHMSGPDLVSRMLPRFPAMRVLYISGYTDEALVHHGIAESGQSFLQKPFLPAALAKKVRDVLDGGGRQLTVS
jgi:signal transduction histidine kinase